MALARPFAPLIPIIIALLLMNLNSGLDVFQNTDFFTYNRCRAILTYDKQLHYLLTDANFF